MISVLSDMMSYTFIVRAMIVGGLVALCSALLGVSLVLKRYSMIGDGLSHVAFAALTIAVAMNVAPLYISTPIVTVAAIILLRLSENSKIKGDSAIALISTVSIAIGVVVTALTDAYNMIIAVLTAITIVVGMRIMGTMLISSLIIFPALISMRNFKTFKSVIICSAIVSVVCFFLGIVLSYLYSIPTGASIVLVNTVALILSYLIGELRN